MTRAPFHVFILAKVAASALPLTMSVGNPEAGNGRVAEEELCDRPELLDLMPFAAGDRIFAVFAGAVDGTTKAVSVTPLPHAPPTVLGIVCTRGRMLTVLDPLTLWTDRVSSRATPLPCLIALRGDEQLALACDSCRDTITIASADIETPKQGGALEGLALGLIRYAGEEIIILNLEKLFASAMRHRERRRRRL